MKKKYMCSYKCPAYKKKDNVLNTCALCHAEASSGWHECYMTSKELKRQIKECQDQLTLIELVQIFKLEG